MRMIGRYEQITEMGNENAGTCLWCYAKLKGREYFIKEFPEPRYPGPDSKASARLIEKKRFECEKFEKMKIRTYHAINYCSDGNAVRISDFFRVGTKYYMAMPRIDVREMEIKEVAKLPDEVKRRICKVIVHSIAKLHSAHFVHSDIKHANILFTETSIHELTAKLIDFDAGFFEDNPPQCSEEVKGDQIYYSPEAIVVMYGGEAKLTCKLDIFALGILFHQYFSGMPPIYDRERYSCAGMSAADGEAPGVLGSIPEDMRKIISRMLAVNPEDRPTAQEVFDEMSEAVALSYTVNHIINGVIKESAVYEQKSIKSENNRILIEKESLMQRVYSGYRFDRIEPMIKESAFVADGTIINLYYVPDESQKKTVSYKVQHKVDGKVIDSFIYSKQVWLNAPDELPIEKDSLIPLDSLGCEFIGIQYDAIQISLQGEKTVPNGTVITLDYARRREDGFIGDAPARLGWYDMDEL
ncbi:MAG: protein kinase [Lachnospiraceae bacterium]|nr:protein kinase [Lachnospiraceae bacterium]